MTEVVGADVLSTGVRAEGLTTLDFSRLVYSYGRDYFSRYKPCVLGAGANIVDKYGFSEENFTIGTGKAKKMLGIKPITLDPINYGGQDIGISTGDIRPGKVPLAVRLLVARQFGKVFTMDDKDLIDLQYSLPPIFDKALMQAYGKLIDEVIIESLVAPIASVVYDTTQTNAHYTAGNKPLVKYEATINRTNFVYRDGPWTSGNTVGTDRFSPASVYKIQGFFADKGVSGYRSVCMQLTPQATDILASSNEGLRMLGDGGTELIRFVVSQTTQAAGEFIKTGKLGPASAYARANDVITVGARTIGEDHTADEGVLFASNQNMTAAQLNSRPNVSGFEDIELTRDNLIAVWAKDAVTFGEFEMLTNSASKHDIRQNNALYQLNRFGCGATILDENKVMLFPIRGKNKA